MKVFAVILFVLLQTIGTVCEAQTMVSDKQGNKQGVVTITSFPDYAPFFSFYTKGVEEEIETVFDKAIALLTQDNQLKIEYALDNNYENVVTNVRRGITDVLLGMYYDTKLYEGLEYLYPAVLNNPVHVAMLPENMGKISKLDDLKKLKGVFIAKEHLSDYMLNNFKKLNLESVPDSKTAYEKLFIGEVDYVMGSYYYNYIEVVKMGLKNYVSFSKGALWNMPLFIGMSKSSPKYRKLKSILEGYVAKEQFRQSIEDSLKEHMYKTEVNSQGVVPPTFVRASAEVTPADEVAAPDIKTE